MSKNLFKIIALLLLTSINIFGEDNNTLEPCNHDLIKIVYGKPSAKTLTLEKEHKVMLGGCMVREDAPRYYCTKCKEKF